MTGRNGTHMQSNRRCPEEKVSATDARPVALGPAVSLERTQLSVNVQIALCSKSLSPTQKLLLVFLDANPGSSTEEVAKWLGMKVPDVEGELREFSKYGVMTCVTTDDLLPIAIAMNAAKP